MPGRFKEYGVLLRQHYAVLLIASVPLLFCTSALFNLPFFIMALLGLYRVLKMPQRLRDDPALLALSICFLSLWLPQLLSLPDAVMPSRAIKTTAAYVHFFFAGVFIILSIRQKHVLEKINLAVFVILSVWIIDALLQFILGHNLLGYPYEYKGQLTGMFHPKIRLGHAVAVFLPFYLEFLYQHGRRHRGSWLLLVLFFLVLLLSGKRMAWITAAIGGLAYAIYFFAYHRDIKPRWLLLPFATTVLYLLAFTWQYPPAKERVDKALLLFSGDYELINQATSRRLPAWRTGLNVFKHNPINGIGPRGFRYVYQDYAADEHDSTTHPHQFLLEVAAETGIIGLLGFTVFCCYLLFIGRRQLAFQHRFMPWLLCAGVAWLPINAHYAFYGSYWSSVGWWILCIALAQLFGHDRPENHSKPQKVLIIKLGALGDVIMSTPLIAQIQQHHQHAAVFLLTSPAFAPLFVRWSDLTVQAFPRKGVFAALKTLAWIRQQGFALAYDLQSSHRSGIYCALSGIARRCGNHPHFPYHLHPPEKWHGQDHIFDRMLEVLRAAGIKAKAQKPFLPPGLDDRDKVANWLELNGLQDRKLALLHAGSSPQHPQKRWPYFALLAEVLEAAGYAVIWLGADADAELNSRLARLAGKDATNRFSLAEIIALGQAACFAVTNDSAPMHVLSCCNLPVYGLFGPTDWRRCHGIGQAANVISLDKDKARFVPTALADLTVTEVVEQLTSDGLLQGELWG